MQHVPYDIAYFSYSGDTLSSLENIKTEDISTHWEAKTSGASLVLTFPPTQIHELRLALRSSAELIVTAEGNEKVTLLDKTEYVTTEEPKKVKYVNNEHGERDFTRLELEITNLVPDKPLSVVYFRIYRSGVSLKRKAESPLRSPPMHRPKLTPILPPPTAPVLPLALPPPQEPAECSYSALLRNCQIFSLDERTDHIHKLCTCLGACWVEQLTEATHVILTAQLIDVMREIKDRSSAKFVTAEWLEGCLRDRERKSEADFTLYEES